MRRPPRVAALFDFEVEGLLGRLVLTGLCTWLAAGFLRSTLIGEAVNPDPVRRPPTGARGAVEAGVVLGLLNALFLTFVLVQFRYFFGGTAGPTPSGGGSPAREAMRRGVPSDRHSPAWLVHSLNLDMSHRGKVPL